MNVWQSLSARSKRWAAIAGALLAFLLFTWGIVSGSTEENERTRRQALNEAILTDADTRDTTIDRLAAQLEAARDENRKLAKSVEKLAARQEKIPDDVADRLQRQAKREADTEKRQLEARLKQLETELEDLHETASTAKEQAVHAKSPAGRDEPEEKQEPAVEPAVKPASTGVVFPEAVTTLDETDPAAVFRRSGPQTASVGKPGAVPAGGATSAGDAIPAGDAAKQDQPLSIRFVSKKDNDAAIAGNTPVPDVGENLFKLPATSILTGTLITGLDAPTGAQAQQAPLPVLLRLKKEAILPNRFKADVRECFALLGAFGDLSSERAQMRGEVMSCVLHDGTILEQPLKGFAVGEDGKAGPRGRLVRREGTFIARAITVGLLEAAANALNDNQVVQVGSGFDPQAAAASITGSAAGSALGRVADWYIDQAFQLFPVIEIDAGRQIDVVLTGTFEMNLPLEDG